MMNDFDFSSTGDFTGRYLVVLDQNRLNDSINLITALTDLNSVAATADLYQNPEQRSSIDVIVLPTLGVAIINQPLKEANLQSMAAAVSDETSPILSMEPEQYCYALADVSISPSYLETEQTSELSMDYLRGYRDGVAHIVDNMTSNTSVIATSTSTAPATWGLEKTNALKSKWSGKGIKVAVLDTGFELAHPDFTGRTIVSQSFVLTKNPSTGKYEPTPVQDVGGHGTHCIGTACGPRNPKKLTGYGIAYQSDIYVGRVLNQAGIGLTGEILDGMEWATTQGCHVISMSLGIPKKPGKPYLKDFELIAQRALTAGSLIVAAAGNMRKDPKRDGKTAINHPADCPSVMAVAAIDQSEKLADFSCASDGQAGGQIDIAAPGVDVYSSYILSTRLGTPTSGYTRMSGTSMATPHVAGIAALYAEANPGVRGQALWNLVVRGARRLPLPSTDVGAGLVQAP